MSSFCFAMLAKNHETCECESNEERKTIITGEIQRNTERCPQFIVSSVPFPYRGVRIVHARKDAGFAQFGSCAGEQGKGSIQLLPSGAKKKKQMGGLTNFPNKRIKLLFRAEWDDQNLCRGNQRRQGQNLIPPQIQMKIASVSTAEADLPPGSHPPS